jgi:rhodanese-related sulfurtransferase
VHRLWSLLALVSLCASGAGAAELTGEVGLAVGGTVKLTTAEGEEIVALERGAALLGCSRISSLRSGDQIRVTYSRRLAGVIMAETLAVPPEVVTDPELVIGVQELDRLIRGEESHPLIIDARQQDRYAAGHLPAAVSVPADATDRLVQQLPEEAVRLIVVYSEGLRCPLALTALRRFLAAGHDKVRVLLEGVQGWQDAGGPVLVEPGAVARLLDSGAELLVVDVREPAVDSQTLPSAVSIPLQKMRWQDFSGEAWLPPILFVGADNDDRSPFEAATRTVGWRYRHETMPHVPVQILAGGMSAWVAGGYPTSSLADAGTSIGYDPDPEDGEISHAELRRLWQQEDGEAVLLDVRDPLTRAPSRAIHIPLEELPYRIGELPMDREIVAYCNLGYRASLAYEILRRNGYLARFLHAHPRVEL